MFDFAGLERRVSALEAQQTASMRIGRVKKIEGGKARVEFRDGQDMKSYKLSTVQKRVNKDKDIEMPELEEPVVCLFSGQGCEDGVVLGAYYNDREDDPKQPDHYQFSKREDGTFQYYDKKEHMFKFHMEGGGTIRIECGPNLIVIDDKGIKVRAPRIDLNP